MATSQLPPPWVPQADRLRNWFYAYLVLWIPGMVLFISSFGSVLLVLALIPYVMAIVHAYRVQRDLQAAGLNRTHAWTVIVGALLLTHTLGFFIPALVLWSARKAKRTL